MNLLFNYDTYKRCLSMNSYDEIASKINTFINFIYAKLYKLRINENCEIDFDNDYRDVIIINEDLSVISSDSSEFNYIKDILVKATKVAIYIDSDEILSLDDINKKGSEAEEYQELERIKRENSRKNKEQDARNKYITADEYDDIFKSEKSKLWHDAVNSIEKICNNFKDPESVEISRRYYLKMLNNGIYNLYISKRESIKKGLTFGELKWEMYRFIDSLGKKLEGEAKRLLKNLTNSKALKLQAKRPYNHVQSFISKSISHTSILPVFLFDNIENMLNGIVSVFTNGKNNNYHDIPYSELNLYISEIYDELFVYRRTITPDEKFNNLRLKSTKSDGGHWLERKWDDEIQDIPIWEIMSDLEPVIVFAWIPACNYTDFSIRHSIAKGVVKDKDYMRIMILTDMISPVYWVRWITMADPKKSMSAAYYTGNKNEPAKGYMFNLTNSSELMIMPSIDRNNPLYELYIKSKSKCCSILFGDADNGILTTETSINTINEDDFLNIAENENITPFKVDKLNRGKEYITDPSKLKGVLQDLQDLQEK